jgi:hypothetical protein
LTSTRCWRSPARATATFVGETTDLIQVFNKESCAQTASANARGEQRKFLCQLDSNPAAPGARY